MRMHRLEYFKINENDPVVLELLQAVKNTNMVKQIDAYMPLLQTQKTSQAVFHQSTTATPSLSHEDMWQSTGTLQIFLTSAQDDMWSTSHSSHST
jgi:hypothetical protein